MAATVHLVFKTHLDVGFTDFGRNVVATYFERFIPQALRLAETLRREAGPERFVWTTGSWLIYEYLERAGPSQRRGMEEAIAAGDIAWHALPFTLHSELMDADLFRAGLGLSQELDRRFGKRTIAAKMTDVPGHTRAIVPLLAEAGITFLHIGVNPASTPPDVPPVFTWRDPCGAEVMVMYHRGSYGGHMEVPGLDDALVFAHTGDNTGPQSPELIRSAFSATRDHFPGADVRASTLDAFASRLATVRSHLPVVTGEIGDTWIHGVGSDPGKVSRFRELSRLRRQWLAHGRVDSEDLHFKAFTRRLLLVPEHTWGINVNTHLSDWVHYSAADFRAVRSRESFRRMEASWAEQRSYLDEAVEELRPSPLFQEAHEALKQSQPARPDYTSFESVPEGQTLETAHYRLLFDDRGALVRLQDRSTGRNWASRAHPVALFSYETFAQDDYDRFYRQYIVNKRRVASWALPDFTKPGMASAGAVHRDWLPTLSGLYRRRDVGGWRFLLELAMPEAACTDYGCPRLVTAEWVLPDAERRLDLTLQWFDKEACRLPEALWLTFGLRVEKPQNWCLDKMGQLISPLEVVPDGNRKLHAVTRGMFYQGSEGEVELETLDAPLVAPGHRSLLRFDNRQPALTRGVHFLLGNNVWGTNFRMWYDEDARFRFRLRLPGPPEQRGR